MLPWRDQFGEKVLKQEDYRSESCDRVRLNNPVIKVGLKKKLSKNNWKWPYIVKGKNKFNIKLEVEGKTKVVHSKRVIPAERLRSRYGRIYKPVERLGIEN